MMTDRWWHPLAKIGDTTVWHVDLTPSDGGESAALDWLDDRERSRCRRYLYPEPERRFALVRAALRALLCDRLGIPNESLAFETCAYGKPFALVDGLPVRISFSVSHSGSHGLVAVAEKGRLGVDIEERNVPYDVDELGAAVFSPGERADITAVDGERKLSLFLTVWTAKEALLKAVGTGLSYDPRRLEIPPALRCGYASAVFRFPTMPAVRWRLDAFGNDDYAGTIAQELVPGASSFPAGASASSRQTFP